MSLRSLKIGELEFELPIIQGGMGVGVSRCNLAGAVSKCGGLGIISTAQIGYDEPGFEKAQIPTNLKAIGKHIRRAKEIAGGKPVGVNIMVATKRYPDYVKAAAQAGADVIISGAGLPVKLPEYVEGYQTKIAPVVSSAKAARVMLKNWDRRYRRTADFIVVEGPEAGGHLGFSLEQLENLSCEEYEQEIIAIIEVVREYEEKYSRKIPVIVAGGIFDYGDICHVMDDLGADGVQIASRFVATEECDASDAFKQAYIEAKQEDIGLVISPVGMPGRAILNSFIERTKQGRIPVTRCSNCLERCNPAETPYCITVALTNAVRGDLEHGLVFVGSNVERIHEMTTVPELMQELSAPRAKQRSKKVS